MFMQSNKSTKSIMSAVIMLSLALAIRQMSMTMVMPFLSTYSKSLIGYTPVLAGFAVGVFGLMQAIFQIPFGILSDRFGNKRLMIIGLTQVIVGLAIASFSKNIGLLIFSRALQGSGAVIAVGYSWVAGMAKEKEQVKAMSILGAFISAAAALAFGIGPLLRQFMPTNWMFLFCAILLFLNELYILFFIKDSKSNESTKSPQKGQIRILIKDKSFILMNLVAFLNNFMMMSVFYAVPIYITRVIGEEGMWKVFVPAIVVAIFVMKDAVKWSQKGFANQVLMILFIFSSLSIILFLVKITYVFLLLGTTFFMCGYISLATIIATNVNQTVSESCRGTANGIFNSFQYIGSFMGAVVTGAIWDKSQKASWYVVIIVGIVAVFIIAKGKLADDKMQELEENK